MISMGWRRWRQARKLSRHGSRAPRSAGSCGGRPRLARCGHDHGVAGRDVERTHHDSVPVPRTRARVRPAGNLIERPSTRPPQIPQRPRLGRGHSQQSEVSRHKSGVGNARVGRRRELAARVPSGRSLETRTSEWRAKSGNWPGTGVFGVHNSSTGLFLEGFPLGPIMSVMLTNAAESPAKCPRPHRCVPTPRPRLTTHNSWLPASWRPFTPATSGPRTARPAPTPQSVQTPGAARALRRRARSR